MVVRYRAAFCAGVVFCERKSIILRNQERRFMFAPATLRRSGTNDASFARVLLTEYLGKIWTINLCIYKPSGSCWRGYFILNSSSCSLVPSSLVLSDASLTSACSPSNKLERTGPDRVGCFLVHCDTPCFLMSSGRWLPLESNPEVHHYMLPCLLS